MTAPKPAPINITPVAIVGLLTYYNVKLGTELAQTIAALNLEKQSYAQHMQAVAHLNQLLLNKANERQCEHDAYKKRCSEPPPPGLGPCEKKIWQLQRNLDCRDMRSAWDNKWQPGRHDLDLLQLTKGIDKQQQWIKDNCN